MKSSIKYGLVLFSVLMAVSLGVAYAEKQMASNNTSKAMPLNNTTVVGRTLVSEERPLKIDNNPVSPHEDIQRNQKNKALEYERNPESVHNKQDK